ICLLRRHYAFELRKVLVMAAKILSAAQAVSEFVGGTLTDAVEVEDTSAQISAYLDGLETIAHAGRLTSIALTGVSTVLIVKAAQLTSDAQALAKISGPYSLAVKDTAADVSAALAALEAAAKAGRLASITLTDA